MKPVALALLAFLFYTCLNAQQNLYTVKPGESIDKTLAASIKFHYPAFTQGIVFFRDGTTSYALLDYNLLNGEIQFIAPKGDTLAVANEATTKYITINKDTFFYDKLFVQLVTGNANAKLAKKETLAIGDIKKIGAYDQATSTSSITTISSVNSNGRVTNLTEQKEVTLSKKITYYIGDTYNHFLPASKKNIVKLFGQKQRAIEQYLKDNKTAFDKEEDLKSLIVFLAE